MVPEWVKTLFSRVVLEPVSRISRFAARLGQDSRRGIQKGVHYAILALAILALFAFLATIVIVSSLLCYVGTYWIMMPTIETHRQPLYFDFSGKAYFEREIKVENRAFQIASQSVQTRLDLLDLSQMLPPEQVHDIFYPKASVPVPEDVLDARVPYDFKIELRLPESPANINSGMFMTQIKLMTGDSMITEASRSMTLRYYSDIYRLFVTVFKCVPMLLGFADESQLLSATLLERYYDPTNKVRNIEIRISDPMLQIYEASLVVIPHPTGLIWFFHNHFIIATLLTVFLITSAAFIYVAMYGFYHREWVASSFEELQATVSTFLPLPDAQPPAALPSSRAPLPSLGSYSSSSSSLSGSRSKIPPRPSFSTVVINDREVEVLPVAPPSEDPVVPEKETKPSTTATTSSSSSSSSKATVAAPSSSSKPFEPSKLSKLSEFSKDDTQEEEEDDEEEEEEPKIKTERREEAPTTLKTEQMEDDDTIEDEEEDEEDLPIRSEALDAGYERSPVVRIRAGEKDPFDMSDIMHMIDAASSRAPPSASRRKKKPL